MEGHNFNTIEKYHFGQDQGVIRLLGYFAQQYPLNHLIRKSKIIFPNI
tara:strand:- start:1782 stop:1925 length:144 start_codon:yes stop_codon:yes gene_type:complete